MIKALKEKRLRLAIAGGILLIVLTAVLPYLLNHVSYAAFVNAELVRISAPMSGAVGDALPSDGEYIAEDRTLPLLQAVAPDGHRLADLEQQHASAMERLALARAQLEAVERRQDELTRRAEEFRRYAQSIAEKNASLYDAELAECRVEMARLSDDRDRAAQLAESGAGTARAAELAQSELSVQAARCEAADARLGRALIAGEAAARSIFLVDAPSDAPYASQELDRLFLRRLDLESAVGAAEVLEHELARLIDLERDRFALATRFEAKLPGQHVVWSVGASRGSAVVEGQTLLELADCSTRFVSVLLSERAASAIATGESASVRLVGSGRWLRGTVSTVTGSAARRDDHLLAAQSPEPGGDHFLVEVALPESALDQDDSDRCGVGRMAEVRFHRFGSAPKAPAPQVAQAGPGPA